MDPDALLAELLDAQESFVVACEGGSSDAEHAAAVRMAEAVDSLDEWLSKGGFLPGAWRLNRMSA